MFDKFAADIKKAIYQNKHKVEPGSYGDYADYYLMYEYEYDDNDDQYKEANRRKQK